MLTREEYIKRVTILGRYCYPERGEETARIVFSCLKETLSGESLRAVSELLPGPVKGLWQEAPFDGRASGNAEDCISLAKERGKYPYRAAAERAFEVIFASLGESLGDDGKIRMADALPPPLRVLFERSRSCALDGAAEDFL